MVPRDVQMGEKLKKCKEVISPQVRAEVGTFRGGEGVDIWGWLTKFYFFDLGVTNYIFVLCSFLYMILFHKKQSLKEKLKL